MMDGWIERDILVNEPLSIVDCVKVKVTSVEHLSVIPHHVACVWDLACPPLWTVYLDGL